MLAAILATRNVTPPPVSVPVYVPLWSTYRVVASTAVFRGIFAAKTAQVFTTSATTIGALNTVYARLYNDYFILITVPPFQVSSAGTNIVVPFSAAVVEALADMTTLNNLVQGMPPGQQNPAWAGAQYGVNPNQVNPANQTSLLIIQNMVAAGLAQVQDVHNDILFDMSRRS